MTNHSTNCLIWRGNGAQKIICPMSEEPPAARRSFYVDLTDLIVKKKHEEYKFSNIMDIILCCSGQSQISIYAR